MSRAPIRRPAAGSKISALELFDALQTVVETMVDRLEEIERRVSALDGQDATRGGDR